jgi:hypothetical protein
MAPRTNENREVARFVTDYAVQPRINGRELKDNRREAGFPASRRTFIRDAATSA